MVLILRPHLIGYSGSDSWSAMMATRVQGLSASMYTTPGGECSSTGGFEAVSIELYDMAICSMHPFTLLAVCHPPHAPCPRSFRPTGLASALLRLLSQRLQICYLFVVSSFYHSHRIQLLLEIAGDPPFKAPPTGFGVDEQSLEPRQTSFPRACMGLDS